MAKLWNWATNFRWTLGVALTVVGCWIYRKQNIYSNPLDFFLRVSPRQQVREKEKEKQCDAVWERQWSECCWDPLISLVMLSVVQNSSRRVRVLSNCRFFFLLVEPIWIVFLYFDSCVPDTDSYKNPIFFDPLFYTSIPFLFLCFLRFLRFTFLCSRQALNTFPILPFTFHS